VIHTVGVADLKISADPGDVIVTHALGSCLGITIFDPVARIGGMLHAMLPESTRLFRDCYKLGAEKPRLVVKVAGGATSKANLEDDYFQIGKRNFIMLRKLLWKNSVLLKSYDVGGNNSRTLSLEIESGQVLVRSNGTVRAL
jgi:chemotaxis protein CheD